MNSFVNTVEDKIQSPFLTAIDSINAPKIELAFRSINASSGQDVTRVTANYERGEYKEITAPFEDASENNNVLHVSKMNYETRNNLVDKVSVLLIPGSRYDRQSHTHHTVTLQTTQAHQIPEFLTGLILTPRYPPSHQHQSLSTEV